MFIKKYIILHYKKVNLINYMDLFVASKNRQMLFLRICLIKSHEIAVLGHSLPLGNVSINDILQSPE